jgi:hypothetical protein
VAIQVCNISQNVPVKGLSTGERTQDSSFQGKTSMGGGDSFLARNYVLERSRISDSGNYEAVAEKTKNTL